MRLFKPDVLALSCVVDEKSEGFDYRWKIRCAYTRKNDQECLLSEHELIEFLRKQHVPQVLDDSPIFTVRGLMQKKRVVPLIIESYEAWFYADLALSLLCFRVAIHNQSIHAAEMKTILFALDYVHPSKQRHIGQLHRALLKRIGPERSQYLANQGDLLPRGMAHQSDFPVVRVNDHHTPEQYSPKKQRTIRKKTFCQNDLNQWSWQDLHCQECCFDEVRFEHITLRQVTFENCTFRGVRFIDCQAIEVIWQYCDMAFAHWQRVNAAQCQFIHTQFRHGILRHTTWFECCAQDCRWVGVSLDYAAWHGMHITDCCFSQLDYKRWGLADARLLRCQFDRVVGKQFMLSGTIARVRHSHFVHCHFPQANWTESRWSHCRFEQCDVAQLQAQQSRWWDCQWQRNNLRESQWSGSLLLISQFNDNFLAGANLQWLKQNKTLWQGNVVDYAQGLAT